MKIIGLTSHEWGNHDASVALLSDGQIKSAIAEERITRKKHDTNFPINALNEVLLLNKIKLSKVDYFVSGSPRINYLRFLITYLKGIQVAGFKKTIQWLIARIALLLNSRDHNIKTRKNTQSIFEIVDEKKIKFTSHYLAHAQTAYMFSGQKKSLVVAWDGYGMETKGYPVCGAVFIGENNKLKKVEEIPVFTSLALYYGAVTVALGFKLNDGEGKTMGLAVYGKKSPALKMLKGVFPFFDGKKWRARKNWLEINGVSRLEYFRLTPTYRYLRYLVEEYGSEQVAYAAQVILEEEGEKYFRYLVSRYKIKDASVAGGIFLNVKFNMNLLKNKVLNKIFIYPNPSDGGVAVGAALDFYLKNGGQAENVEMRMAGLGRKFSDREIKTAIKKFNKDIKVKKYKKQLLYKEVAKRISKGKVIGWFTGADEWGPRALGHRSVLADPREITTKDRINDKLKQRDWFMPFAPVILHEKMNEVLEHGYGTAFMTLTDDIAKNWVKKIPAAIHIDNTARAQVVTKEANFPYWSVVNEFYKLTKVPVLLNTSFNKHGLPIVHTPYEAIEHLIWGCVDELIVEDYIITKK